MTPNDGAQRRGPGPKPDRLRIDGDWEDAIADAMLRLSQDEALRQHLIAAGHENVKRFSWSKAARETLAVLVAAARGKNNAALDDAT